jgi:uncharacterized protein with GYD domain
MPHYLFRASYTQQGIQGLMKEGAASRVRANEDTIAGLDGRVICQYWAFGDDDYIAIAELPDNAAAAALAGTVGANGVAKVSTSVLLEAADVDEARSRAVSYRPPGA